MQIRVRNLMIIKKIKEHNREQIIKQHNHEHNHKQISEEANEEVNEEVNKEVNEEEMNKNLYVAESVNKRASKLKKRKSKRLREHKLNF